MKEIVLNKNHVSLVDDSDFDFLNTFTWYRSVHGYASSTVHGKAVYMHRLIMQPPGRLQVDHINRDKLDNRRENLRLSTQAQNSRNKAGFGKTSRYKGVRHDCRNGYWVASIVIGGISKHIGCFSEEREAAIAFDRAVDRYRKDENSSTAEFEYQNFPELSRQSRGGRQKERAVKACLTDGSLYKQWASGKEAVKDGFSKSCISSACNGKVEHYKGLHWSFVNC